jgi:hypothetical protein
MFSNNLGTIMSTGIFLKVDQIPFEDGLHLMQYLKSNGFIPIDVNHQRPSQISAAIKKTQTGRKQIPVLVDACDEFKCSDEIDLLGTVYPVLDITDPDELKTLSLIQETLGIVATG